MPYNAGIETSEAEKIGIKRPREWPGAKKTEGSLGQPEPASGRTSVVKYPKKKKKRTVGGAGGDSAGSVATTGGGTSMGTKEYDVETEDDISRVIGKDDHIKEGDFVMGETTAGVAHGVVEHIMWEGGTLGTPGSDYALESMPPDNPAMSVRIYEEDMDDEWVPTPYSIGMMYADATVYDMEDHDMDEDMDAMYKAEREREKALFADFGKDLTKASRLTEVFKADSVRVGQMVSWNSSGGTARGKVKRVISNGSYKVPGTDVTVTGTKEDPAAVITLYRDGEATDTIVAHKVKTLRAS